MQAVGQRRAGDATDRLLLLGGRLAGQVIRHPHAVHRPHAVHHPHPVHHPLVMHQVQVMQVMLPGRSDCSHRIEVFE